MIPGVTGLSNADMNLLRICLEDLLSLTFLCHADDAYDIIFFLLPFQGQASHVVLLLSTRMVTTASAQAHLHVSSSSEEEGDDNMAMV